MTFTQGNTINCISSLPLLPYFSVCAFLEFTKTKQNNYTENHKPQLPLLSRYHCFRPFFDFLFLLLNVDFYLRSVMKKTAIVKKLAHYFASWAPPYPFVLQEATCHKEPLHVICCSYNQGSHKTPGCHSCLPVTMSNIEPFPPCQNYWQDHARHGSRKSALSIKCLAETRIVCPFEMS